MKRVLILYAHPAPHKSLVNRQLIKAAEEIDAITVRHLYELYPDFLIDVRKEQELLSQHDVVVFQHPFYWYSSPSIVKEWQDLVLEHGWAYGEGATALHGKCWMQAVTSGGGADVYCPTGRNSHSVRDFLLPFERTAMLCGMSFYPPFVVHGTGSLKSKEDVAPHAQVYRRLLEALLDDVIDPDRLEGLAYINSVPLESLINHTAP